MSEPAHPLVPLTTDHQRDLFTWTTDWTARWFDRDESMVWNPPGSFGEPSLARTFHLTPNTAWFAYGALASGRADRRADAWAALRRLLDLQYDAPGQPWDGTFSRVLEAPVPRPGARIWEDYDPNWRQFVGTTFALLLEDLGDQLDEALAAEIDASIGRCVDGEPDGRIDPSYTNPALMRSWLDAWFGARHGRADLVARGERFATEIVTLFDRHGAFDEFNSPTYYGIDLLALRLWQAFPPSPWFAEQGARLEAALWASTAAFFNPALGTFAGPFTRAYTPDARRAISVMALWMWADAGRAAAPLPDLDAESIEHGHDLMAGPVIARLAAPEPRFAPLAAPEGGRRVTQTLAAGRTVTTVIGPRHNLGLESSANDWGGWTQFMPLVFHWRDGDDVGSCWLHRPHVVNGTLDRDLVALQVGGVDEIHLLTFGEATTVAPGVVALGDHARLTVTMGGEPLDVDVDPSSGGAVHRLTIHPDQDGSLHLRFDVVH